MSSSRRKLSKIPERPNTFRSRKRRPDDVPRANEGPKRRRMNNGEDGQKTGHDPKPIGFKALESICREELPEKAVLELTRKAGQFEALLSMDDIRPDLLKLVITSFRMLCSSNNMMTANAEKILRSTKAKRFLTGTVLSSFINKMAYLGGNSGVDTVIMDLIAIFLTMIQKLGESIVHSLPIPQLSISLAVLKEKNLIENGDDLEKKLQHVTELKDEVIHLAMSGHDQESQLKPPQNFKELSVIPSAADLLCTRPFLRKNITHRRFNDLDHYLDVQFRLLREDFVMPLRDGIKQLTKDKDLLEPTTSNTSPRANDVSVYHGVRVLYPVCNRKGRVFKIKFNQCHSKVRRVKWERSKRLKFGSLLCLSSDDFNTLVFASVENRDPEGLSDGELEVRFETTKAADVNRFIQSKETFVMVESDAYFESYRHVLEGLQEINPEEFPFQRYIVECCQDIGPPAYQLHGKEGDEKNNSFTFKLDRVLAKKKSPETLVSNHYSSSLRLQGASEHALETDSSQPGEGSGELSSDAFTESLNSPDVVKDKEMPHEIFNWPDRESLGLNESQMRAFKLALTKEFALIQGPPGTGKTFVGLKIARTLLDNASLWQDEKGSSPILMVSYTNHALDQFLEGLIPSEDIVRVGGRSKSETLEPFNLKSLKPLRASTVADARRTTRNDVRMHKQSFQESSLLMKALKSSIISLEFFRDQGCIQRRHYREFCTLAGRRSINDQLLKWLDITRNDRSNANDDNRDDILMEVSIPGYDFDSDEEDIEGDYKITTLQKITVLSIKDSDNPNYMKRNLKNKAMSEQEERRVGSLIKLNRRDRWRLYRLWCQRLEKRHQKNLQSCQVEFEEALSRDKELDKMIEYNVLRQARVIGMTTTCAARYRHILQRISPKIVLVEEAAEVLEAHLITSLSKGCQHLILIGDHQQLRPNPTVYELAKNYNLDVSLFERMVNVGIPCEKLSVQHRMRPEIAALLKHIYPDLESHESVKEYEDIKGIKKNMFFVNHSHLENSNDESHSHSNEHEAAFVVALCRYLLQQGYSAGQITLLTTYTGQMFAIKDCIKQQNSEEFKGVRLTTVDNFQGEENDIILLSLVRSNKNENVGFIKIMNRACVALSRAKKGFYCIGNFDLLSNPGEIWSKIVADLKASDSIGQALPLVCETHKDEVAAETAEDFSDKVPDGGCQRRCEVRLRCGHACKLLCHPGDPKHKKYVCGEPCGRNIEGCTHTCPNRCSEPCEKQCKELVEKALPNCGHITQVECFTDLNRILCKERCSIILSCNHRCQNYCQRPCTIECMELVKRTDWPCGHEVTVACSAMPSDCPAPCGATLDCGHTCAGKCGECRMGRVHKRCTFKCGRLLVCSHECGEACVMSCPPCSRVCENRCVHSVCGEKCYEPCIPCREPCSWECRHHKCFKMCYEMCSRPRCNRPCKKILPCYHVCRGLECQKECICTVCDTNDGDPITTILFGGEEDEDARFIKLPDCGHIFAVLEFDRYMDKSEDDSTDSHVIQMKRCPLCRKTIRCSLRYGNVIKQQLQDIEKVKNEIRTKSSPELPNKALLLVRLTTLLTEPNADNHQNIRRLIGGVVKEVDGLRARILENKAMLMERYCLMTEKLEKYLKILPEELCAANLFNGQVANDLTYLLKRFMAERVTTRELLDVNTEFSRLSLHLELCLLRHGVKVLALQLDQPFCEMMTTASEQLSTGKRIEDEWLDEMMNNFAAIRKAYPAVIPFVTKEEKREILKAIGLKQGHWYKCPKGHIYAIGECGGAMQRGTCPECAAVIGGEKHRLEEGNELAPEMDGARHAAWSEQANLENYVIADEA